MVEQHLLLDQQMKEAGGLVSQGSVNAITGLSQMLGQEIQVHSLNPRRVPVGDLAEVVGGRESVSVGVYLAVSGSGSGHMFLMFPPETAMELIDMLMGEHGKHHGFLFPKRPGRWGRINADSIAPGGDDGHGWSDLGRSSGEYPGRLQ